MSADADILSVAHTGHLGLYEESPTQIRKTGSYEVSPPHFCSYEVSPPSFALMKNPPQLRAYMYG